MHFSYSMRLVNPLCFLVVVVVVSECQFGYSLRYRFRYINHWPAAVFGSRVELARESKFSCELLRNSWKGWLEQTPNMRPSILSASVRGSFGFQRKMGNGKWKTCGAPTRGTCAKNISILNGNSWNAFAHTHKHTHWEREREKVACLGFVYGRPEPVERYRKRVSYVRGNAVSCLRLRLRSLMNGHWQGHDKATGLGARCWERWEEKHSGTRAQHANEPTKETLGTRASIESYGIGRMPASGAAERMCQDLCQLSIVQSLDPGSGSVWPRIVHFHARLIQLACYPSPLHLL